MVQETIIYIASFLGIFTITFYLLSFLDKKEKVMDYSEQELPSVSIIIPAFNEEKGIKGSINSALGIDYPKDKLEIIVVDDGSKDSTYEKIKEYQNERIRVFKHNKNMGKGIAINKGIKEAKGKVIVTMDADNTLVEKTALKKAVKYFRDPEVMCVSPIMAIYKPKGILQRVQQIEYLLGVFLRKSFANLEAVHITPGAFSIYRKSFFDKYGGFPKNNLTEDMEVALRIQYHGYKIENSLESVIYTIAPNKFDTLLKQRKRWYVGLLKNLWDYRMLFSKKYGVLGTIVLPMAIVSIISSIIITASVLHSTIMDIIRRVNLWGKVNFDLIDNFEISTFVFKKLLFKLFSEPINYLFIILLLFLIFYMFFSKRYVKKYSTFGLSLLLFLIFYAILFAFWWVISIFYFLFKGEVKWR